MLNGFPNAFQAAIPAMQPGRITTFHYSVLPAGLSKKKHEKKMPLSEKKNTISAKKKHFLALYLFLKGYFVYLFYTKYPLSTCLKLLTTYSYSLIFQKPPILQNSKHL